MQSWHSPRLPLRRGGPSALSYRSSGTCACTMTSIMKCPIAFLGNSRLRRVSGRCTAGLSTAPAVVCLAPKRMLCLVRASSHPKEGEQRQQPASTRKTLSAMPKLPDRPRTAQGSKSPKPPSSSKKAAKRPAGGPSPPPPSLPPEQLRKQAQERNLAGMLAYSGLLGTVATGASMVLPGIDLFGNFSMNTGDITLGLQLLVPSCLLNLAIMGPDYSSWKVPQEPSLEAQQKMAESLVAWTAKRKAAADMAAAAAPSSSQAADTGHAAEAASSSGGSSGASDSSSSSTSDSSSSSSTGDTTGRPLPQLSASSSSEGSSAAGSGTEVGSLPLPGASPPWLVNNPDPPLPLPLACCKDALLMAQGHYISSSPPIPLSWPMQAGVLLVNCLAAELLYRSVLLQASGGWLTDRILEAGAEDWFLSAAAHLPVLPTPHMTGQLVAVALLSSAWGVAVARQVARMSRRPSLALASQGRVAAGRLMDDMQRMAASRNQQQQDRQQRGQEGGQGHEQQQRQEQQEDDKQAGATSSVSSAEAQQESTEVSGPQESPVDLKQPVRSRQAADLARAAAAAAADQAGADSSASGSRRGSRRGRVAGLPNTLGALALSQVVTGVRDLTQTAGLGLAFALTGNLAAPFVAALVAEGLMTVLQRRGQERSRQRSIAFAKQFASFTRVLRDVQRQQQLKQGAGQEQPAADAQQQQATADALGMPASTHLDASMALASPGSSMHPDGMSDTQEDGDALDAAVAAAVAPGAAALHAAAGAASSDGVVSAASAGGPAGSRMEQTISVLDQLLGEQLGEAAAAAGPHSK